MFLQEALGHPRALPAPSGSIRVTVGRQGEEVRYCRHRVERNNPAQAATPTKLDLPFSDSERQLAVAVLAPRTKDL